MTPYFGVSLTDDTDSVIYDHNMFMIQATGSAIFNGSEPRSRLGQALNFKLGSFVSKECNCMACSQALLELKTWRRFFPVS